MIVLTFNKSTEVKPKPDERILVISTENVCFGYGEDGWFIWQPVAYNHEGEKYSVDIPFEQLQAKYPNENIYVGYGDNYARESSLETFLNKHYLWMPVENFNEVNDYLNLQNL
jgi:hypothetical protein